MRFYSPLRYPGGKNKLSNLISSICKKNNIEGHYIEPYAGGASVALYLLFNGIVRDVTINDFDRSIFAFWHSILNETDKFCRKIDRIDVNLENWYKQKKIQINKESVQCLFKLGFSTFFLNRTNYSGIIDGGMIGGISQDSKYKIDCRFNKKDLIQRIKFIALHNKNIHLMNKDALELIKLVKKDKQTLFYFDPPYFLKGPTLYMNHYNHNDHNKVSKEIMKIKNAKWIVSYDNTPEIANMYGECNKEEYSLNHSAYKSRIGRELLIFSDNLNIPSDFYAFS